MCVLCNLLLCKINQTKPNRLCPLNWSRLYEFFFFIELCQWVLVHLDLVDSYPCTTTSNANLRLPLPVALLPKTILSILLTTTSKSLRNICPTTLSLFFVNSFIGASCNYHLTKSLVVLPHIHLTILIATPILLTFCFLIGQHFVP